MSLAEDDIKLAVSTQWHAFPERFEWIARNGFGMAYTPKASQLQLLKHHVSPYLRENVAVRYHGYFPGYEIGNADPGKAEEALVLHYRAVDAIQGLGEQVMTVHIGLVPEIGLHLERLQQNLSLLVEYAGNRGVMICLENLKAGPTSDPETLVAFAEKSGAHITLDVGHAVSSELVAHGKTTVCRIIEMCSHLLKEVHFYEYETTIHHAPADMSILGPIVDALCETACTWWTIELTDQADILNTRRLLSDYLAQKKNSCTA